MAKKFKSTEAAHKVDIQNNIIEELKRLAQRRGFNRMSKLVKNRSQLGTFYSSQRDHHFGLNFLNSLCEANNARIEIKIVDNK